MGQSSNGPNGSVLFTVTVEVKVPTIFLFFKNSSSNGKNKC